MTRMVPRVENREERNRLRVFFLIKVAQDNESDFLEAYERIREQVAAVSGHLGDQVCQSTTDPEQWVITSEWMSEDHFVAWERSQEHRKLVEPMRKCVADPRSMRFVIRRETG